MRGSVTAGPLMMLVVLIAACSDQAATTTAATTSTTPIVTTSVETTPVETTSAGGTTAVTTIPITTTPPVPAEPLAYPRDGKAPLGDDLALLNMAGAYRWGVDPLTGRNALVRIAGAPCEGEARSGDPLPLYHHDRLAAMGLPVEGRNPFVGVALRSVGHGDARGEEWMEGCTPLTPNGEPYPTGTTRIEEIRAPVAGRVTTRQIGQDVRALENEEGYRYEPGFQNLLILETDVRSDTGRRLQFHFGIDGAGHPFGAPFPSDREEGHTAADYVSGRAVDAGEVIIEVRSPLFGNLGGTVIFGNDCDPADPQPCEDTIRNILVWAQWDDGTPAGEYMLEWFPSFAPGVPIAADFDPVPVTDDGAVTVTAIEAANPSALDSLAPAVVWFREPGEAIGDIEQALAELDGEVGFVASIDESGDGLWTTDTSACVLRWLAGNAYRYGADADLTTVVGIGGSGYLAIGLAASRDYLGGADPSACSPAGDPVMPRAGVAALTDTGGLSVETLMDRLEATSTPLPAPWVGIIAAEGTQEGDAATALEAALASAGIDTEVATAVPGGVYDAVEALLDTALDASHWSLPGLVEPAERSEAFADWVSQLIGQGLAAQAIARYESDNGLSAGAQLEPWERRLIEFLAAFRFGFSDMEARFPGANDPSPNTCKALSTLEIACDLSTLNDAIAALDPSSAVLRLRHRWRSPLWGFAEAVAAVADPLAPYAVEQDPDGFLAAWSPTVASGGSVAVWPAIDGPEVALTGACGEYLADLIPGYLESAP